MLAQHPPGWKIFRTVLFIPFVISGAAYALVFALFYNPRYGLLNSTLGTFGLSDDHDWLFSSGTALWAVAATFVFVLGLIIVLVMAEIASIPPDLYEAAEVDGATPVQRQWHITLPLLRNVIGTVVLISCSGTSRCSTSSSSSREAGRTMPPSRSRSTPTAPTSTIRGATRTRSASSSSSSGCC